MKSLFFTMIALVSLSAQADLVWPRYKVVTGQKAEIIMNALTDEEGRPAAREKVEGCPSATVARGVYKGFLSKAKTTNCRQEDEKFLCVISTVGRGLIASMRTTDSNVSGGNEAFKKIFAKDCSL